MNTFHKLAVTAALVAWLAGSAGCSSSNVDAAQADKDKATALPVEVAHARRGEVHATYSATTTLEANDEATVVAKVQGVVQKILVEEGAPVEAGQVLARLDDDKLQLELQQQLATLHEDEQSFKRNTELYKRKLISADAFDKSKFELQQQTAIADLARLNVKYTSIRAPIAGVVVQRLIKTGNMVTANQSVFVISDFTSLEAKLHIPERELARLKPGQKATLQVDALPNAHFDGAVKRISPRVDPATGTFKVTVALHDPSHRLMPGMFGRVNVIYDIHQNAVLVPRTAVATEDGDTSVFIVDNGIARRQAVRTGYEDGNLIEILDGVQPGTAVVTLGQSNLKDGSKVTIVNNNSASLTRTAAR